MREARQGAPLRKNCGMTSNHSCSHSAFNRSSEISYLPDFMGRKHRNGPPKSRAPVGNVDHARVAGSRYFLGQKYGSECQQLPEKCEFIPSVRIYCFYLPILVNTFAASKQTLMQTFCESLSGARSAILIRGSSSPTAELCQPLLHSANRRPRLAVVFICKHLRYKLLANSVNKGWLYCTVTTSRLATSRTFR